MSLKKKDDRARQFLKPLSPPKFFLFNVDNRRFVFGRDSLASIEIPDCITPTTTRKIEEMFDKLAKETFYAKKPTLRTIALNITNNCNFACRYCFANHGEYGQPGLVMDFSVAKKAIDLLLSTAKKMKSKRVAIAFFGGEPLLSWSLIKKIVKYAKENVYKKISLKFLITTNASLLDENKIDFMKKNNFSIMVSIDGEKKAHDANRIDNKGRGTYDLVVNKIKKANKVIPLTFRATITDNNLDLVKITKHFISIGARMITFGLDNDHLKRSSYPKIIKSYQLLADQYYNDLVSGNFYEITNFSQIFFQLLFREKKISHCNAGLSYLGVAADGLIYKCPRFTDIEGHQFADINQPRKVKDKIIKFRAELRKDARFRNDSCAKCSFVFLCGGMCHYDLLQKGKTIYDLVREQCMLRRTIYQQTIKLYVRLPESTKKAFFLRITDLENRGGGEYYE